MATERVRHVCQCGVRWRNSMHGDADTLCMMKVPQRFSPSLAARGSSGRAWSSKERSEMAVGCWPSAYFLQVLLVTHRRPSFIAASCPSYPNACSNANGKAGEEQDRADNDEFSVRTPPAGPIIMIVPLVYARIGID